MQHMEFCAPGALAGARRAVRLGDRAVGAVRRSRGRARATCCAAARRPASIVSNAAFPYHGGGRVSVAAASQARLFRISFSGELAYELAVPARLRAAGRAQVMAAATFRHRALRHRGAGHHAHREGTCGRRRAERADHRARSRHGTDDVAQEGLHRPRHGGRPALPIPRARALVGLRPVDRTDRLRAGAHFLAVDGAASIENDQGYVTSVAFSAGLGHWIGLGFLARGPERIGDGCGPLTPSAAATRWWRCAVPCSSIRRSSPACLIRRWYRSGMARIASWIAGAAGWTSCARRSGRLGGRTCR